jgi:hypothetical protein
MLTKQGKPEQRKIVTKSTRGSISLGESPGVGFIKERGETRSRIVTTVSREGLVS